jgi:hypothetical protein
MKGSEYFFVIVHTCRERQCVCVLRALNSKSVCCMLLMGMLGTLEHYQHLGAPVQVEGGLVCELLYCKTRIVIELWRQLLNKKCDITVATCTLFRTDVLQQQHGKENVRSLCSYLQFDCKV